MNTPKQGTFGRVGVASHRGALLSSDSASHEFVSEVISFFADTADMMGLPRSVGAIYGVCFASEEPLSFADITLRLRLSQGSISQGLRFLRGIGALKVVGAQARRDYYAPELELRKVVGAFISERLEDQFEKSGERLRILSDLASEPGVVPSLLLTRISYLRSWHEKGRALSPLIATLLRNI